MIPRAATRVEKVDDLDVTVAAMIDHALRGKCCELALFIHKGEPVPPLLLEEAADLTADSWALREGEDA